MNRLFCTIPLPTRVFQTLNMATAVFNPSAIP